VGPTQCGAALNEKHTLGIYLTWGLFKITGNMQYGLCGTSQHGAKLKSDIRHIPAQRGALLKNKRKQNTLQFT